MTLDIRLFFKCVILPYFPRKLMGYSQTNQNTHFLRLSFYEKKKIVPFVACFNSNNFRMTVAIARIAPICPVIVEY